ncbi:MAG: type II secretion system protein [Verrucomicrobiales bacterium]|nr:type II secretion system protein [Verrucomicrobiales bacterium]
MTLTFTSRSFAGFSLVEMLTVVSVIGILSAIGLPAISNIRESAKIGAAKRNAQEAASLSAIADAAGIAHVVPELAGGVEATLAILADGISSPSETGIPIELKLYLSDQEITAAAKFLKLRYLDSGIRMEYNNNPDS